MAAPRSAGTISFDLCKTLFQSEFVTASSLPVGVYLITDYDEIVTSPNGAYKGSRQMKLWFYPARNVVHDQQQQPVTQQAAEEQEMRCDARTIEWDRTRPMCTYVNPTLWTQQAKWAGLDLPHYDEGEAKLQGHVNLVMLFNGPEKTRSRHSRYGGTITFISFKLMPLKVFTERLDRRMCVS